MQQAHSRTAALGVVSGTSLPTSWSRKENKQTLASERTDKMITVIDMLKTAARNYALYRQTRDEIANMPLDVALDLGIYRGDAERIAHEAVYGNAA
jgi:uncharacterized protein YjiS (DUF1127 family)